MLDDLPVHIDNVERAVRSVSKLHGPKPRISRSDKFHFLFVWRALRFQAHTVRQQKFAMHQISTCIPNKSVVEVFFWKGISAINQRAGCAREVTRSAPPAFNRSAD